MSIKIVNYFKKTGKSDHIQNGNYESENKNFDTMNLSRELYKHLFNQIPDGVCIFSFQHDFSKGKIIDANDPLCSILGVEKSVILNLSPDIFFTPSTSNKQEIFNNLIKSNEVLFECTLTHANASPVRAEISSRIVEKTESVVILSVIRDISGKKAKNIEVNKQEDTLRQITENTSPGDKSFFNSLVIQLSNFLKADYAYIGVTSSYNNKIKTISLCKNGEIIPNIEYDLANTPCYNVLEKGVRTYRENVANIFPEDDILKELNIEGYSAVSLISSENKRLGIIVLLFQSSIYNVEFVESLLQVFAAAITAEIERMYTENVLIESEKRYQHIAETITDYLVKVYVENGKAIKTVHSPTCFTVTGYTVEDYEKDTYLWYKMIYDDDRRYVYEKISNIIQGNDTKAFEHRIYHKDGSTRWIRNNPVLFKNDQGEIYEYDAIISDITDLKVIELKMLDSEKQYKLLFNEMNSGCAYCEMIYDHQGRPFDVRFIDINPEFELLTGLKKENISNKTLREVLPYADPQLIAKYGEVVLSGEPVRYEEYSPAFGKYLEIIIFSPKKDYFAVIFQDITESKRAFQALLESEEKYRKLVELSPETICLYSQMKLIYINQAGINLIGASSMEEVIGSDVMKFVHPDYKQFVIERSKQSLNNNDIPTPIYEKFIKLDGTIIDVEVTAATILHNNKPCTLVVVRDISDRKKAEETLRRERDFNSLITQTSPVGIITINIHREIIFANEAAEHLFNLVKDSNNNYYKPDIRLSDINGNVIIPLLRLLDELCTSKNTVFDLQYSFQTYEGQNKFISVNTGPILNPSGDFEGLVITINDVTSSVNANRELLKAKERAEESEMLKTSFLANMSHEIRTPMNGIIGFAGLLGKDDLPADKKEKYIQIIHNSTSQLLTIITDILDISKIEAGQLSVFEEQFNLNTILEELVMQFEIEKKTKNKENIEIVLETGLEKQISEIYSDKSRLSQILFNLIGNALKFTEKGSIHVGYKLISKEKLVFYVKDTGIGVDAEKRKIIFERFRQADNSTTRKYGGTGLGLAICKGLVELLGGRIWMESQPEKGSVFYFSIKYNPVVAINEADNIEPFDNHDISSWKKKTILIVEDVEDNFMLLHEYLSETGANILYSNNGLTSIDIINENPNIDLVLMDIQLPDINGYEATKQIKKIRPEICVIAQTAYGLPGDREKSIEAGCDDYISKPVIREHFLNMVNKHIRKK